MRGIYILIALLFLIPVITIWQSLRSGSITVKRYTFIREKNPYAFWGILVFSTGFCWYWAFLGLHKALGEISN